MPGSGNAPDGGGTAGDPGGGGGGRDSAGRGDGLRGSASVSAIGETRRSTVAGAETAALSVGVSMYRVDDDWFEGPLAGMRMALPHV